MEQKRFETFAEMNDYLLKEGEHQKNRNIVKDQQNIITNIPDGQRIVDTAKEYCKTILNIPERFLEAGYHKRLTKIQAP